MTQGRLRNTATALVFLAVLVLSSCRAEDGVAEIAQSSEMPASFGKAWLTSDNLSALEVDLLESELVGVSLDAPERVAIDVESSLPMLVAARYDGARDWHFPMRYNAALTGIDLRSGEVRAAPLFPSDKKPVRDEPGEAPSSDEMSEFGVQAARFDARELLDLPWSPGCWQLQLLYHDWRSNPVRVVLFESNEAEASCPPIVVLERESAGVEFRLAAQEDDSALVEAEYNLPAGFADDGGVAVSLLLLPRGSSMPARFDWQQELESQAEGWRGSFERELPDAGVLVERSAAYLIVGGELFGSPMTDSP